MAPVSGKKGNFQVKAYRGDFRTLLAWSFIDNKRPKNLAGFTIGLKPDRKDAYYLWNDLKFADPTQHAQMAGEPANSSANAPFHMFRWIHTLGQNHQGLTPAQGKYSYTVTPRFFDGHGHLLALDADAGVSVDIEVRPFVKGRLQVAFTRGYVQSQAFAHHFGVDALLEPDKRSTLFFDTSAQAGKDEKGKPVSFETEYDWCGYTARKALFDFVHEAGTKGWTLDVFAYDFNEPNLITELGVFAKSGKLRVILDNASLHHAAPPKQAFEDDAETFLEGQRAGTVLRGKFGSFAHDKVFVALDQGRPVKVLTGSTNFSVNGLYVNSNHVLIYDDAEVATWYEGVFQTSWDGKVKVAAFKGTEWATGIHSSSDAATPPSDFQFAPHDLDYATKQLGDISDRIEAELTEPEDRRSVLFAIMDLQENSSVLKTLQKVHESGEVFSFGISDTPGETFLYQVGKKQGVLVSGKPGVTELEPPFSKVHGVRGHQVHHKFVVCGFNGPDPVVYCGSSNLVLNPETKNGDNLIAIRDEDVATVFAIEALSLVDHFNFLNKAADEAAANKAKLKAAGTAPKVATADAAGWHLGTTDAWAAKYFDPNDLKYTDRVLFGG